MKIPFPVLGALDDALQLLLEGGIGFDLPDGVLLAFQNPDVGQRLFQ